MKAKNKVISTDWFRNCDIEERNGLLVISPYNIEISKKTVCDYMVIDQKNIC